MKALLLPHHKQMLVESAISEVVAQERGYRSVLAPDDLAELDFADFQRRTPALLVPVHDVLGRVAIHQLRPDDPREVDGKAIKYETPSGGRMTVDVPPRVRARLGDPRAPLIITEGVKKADSAVSHGMCAIALLGVWGWRGTNEVGGKTALPDWEQIALNGRRVLIVFDSDVMTKLPVGKALERLGPFLEMRQADVGLVYLPQGPEGAKVGLDDFLAAGGTAEQLESLARPAKQDMNVDRPRIEWNCPEGHRPLHELVPQAIDALAHTHEDQVFVRGGELVRVLHGCHEESGGIRRGGASRIAILSEEMLRCYLGEAARWISTRMKKGKMLEREDWAPTALVRTVRDHGHWPGLRELVGIVTAPSMRPDGSILDEPGYDEQTKLIFAPLREYGRVPLEPSADQVRAAWKLLCSPWHEFPYESAGDVAAHMAYALTLAARPAVEGSVPHWAFTSPTSRTGKSLMAKTTALGLTGSLPDILVPVGGRAADAEAEMRKRIMTLVMEGTRVALVDNQTDGSTFSSSALAAAITSSEVTDRVLGGNRRASLPHHIVWTVTGNNIVLSQEIAERSLSVHLDARLENPGISRSFEVADLEAHVRRLHPELLVAALTVLRGYVVAGRPVHGKPALGGFEAWDALVRGAVIWVTGLMGEAIDPLETQARLRRDAPERGELGALLPALVAVFGAGRPVKAAAMIDAAGQHGELAEALASFCPSYSEKGGAQKLGMQLKANKDRVVDGLRLEAPDSSGNSRLWAVARVDLREPGGPGGLGGPVRSGPATNTASDDPPDPKKKSGSFLTSPPSPPSPPAVLESEGASAQKRYGQESAPCDTAGSEEGEWCA